MTGVPARASTPRPRPRWRRWPGPGRRSSRHAGITVNVVAPGPTRTAMLEDPNRASVPPIVPPLGRLVEPAEVAVLTRFLLEPTGAMVTGQTIVMCGGASLP